MERDLQSGFEAYQSFTVPNNNGNLNNTCSSNPMFSGVSLLSLLMSSENQYDTAFTPPSFSNINAPANSFLTNPSSLGFFSDETPLRPNHPSFLVPKTPELEPKPEPISSIINFETPTIYNYNTQPLEFLPHYMPDFHRLPDLLSLEQITESSPFPPSLTQKRARVDSSHHGTGLTVPRNVPFSSFKPLPGCWSSKRTPVMVPRGSKLARQRRQKLSEKTRCLQKLLPFDKRMDMTTMLEEAYKYIKFLQAQLHALQTMPANSGFMAQSISSFETVGDYGDLGSVFYGLERLSRNQLLQVLVNSPVSQTMLASMGDCLFSVEQLGLIKNLI